MVAAENINVNSLATYCKSESVTAEGQGQVERGYEALISFCKGKNEPLLHFIHIFLAVIKD